MECRQFSRKNDYPEPEFPGDSRWGQESVVLELRLGGVSERGTGLGETSIKFHERERQRPRRECGVRRHKDCG